jgi:sec-independent protein translocase protein TatC
MAMPGALAAAVLRGRVGLVSHDAQMSTVDHLEELRSRLLVCLAVVGIAFGFCFWQNHELLRLVNAPLAHNTQQQVRQGHGPLGATYEVQQRARDVARQLTAVTGVLADQTHSRADLAALARVQTSLRSDISTLSAPPRGNDPVTLGIGEPFTATLTVTLIFAFILSLPILLLQAYGFLMPAFDPVQRRRMFPVVCAIPLLFVAGVSFGYAIVLPASLHFFQNFNSNQFNVLVQAGQYYKFAATILLAMGLLFQVPVAIVAAVRAGLVTPAQLRRNRRWAVLGVVLVAALIPGDVITMLLETVPLYLLFEASVLIAAISQRRAERKAAA